MIANLVTRIGGRGIWPRRDSSWLFQLDDLGAGHCRLIERARTAIITNNDTVTGKLISTPPGAAALSVSVIRRWKMQSAMDRRAAEIAVMPRPASGPNSRRRHVWEDASPVLASALHRVTRMTLYNARRVTHSLRAGSRESLREKRGQ